jgi:hypothetical protein
MSQLSGTFLGARQTARWGEACVRGYLLAGVLTLIVAVPARAQDDIQIPGGPGSVRRLLGMDPHRSDATFLVDLHQVLLFGTAEKSSWSKVEARRKVVDYTEDLADWRQRFGNPAKFSTAARDPWNRSRDALDWLGVKVRGSPPQFTTEQRGDPDSRRRQAFLDALGTPVASFIDGLRSGQSIAIASADAAAPLPFGIAAWRETLSESGLGASTAFLFFVKNVNASRMLVALSSLDPETRDGLRGLLRDEKGRSVAWRILYDDELDAFSRYPEALMIREGRFVLPGGKDAEPIWTDVFGVQPADRAGFLRALYGTDSGKGAYVVDTLQHLPDATVRELLFGKTGGGAKAVKRFHRLYRSIDRSGDNYEWTQRDPYDFAQLAPFLRLSDEAGLALPVVDFDTDFPRNESELAEIVGRDRGRNLSPEDTLRKLFRGEAVGASGSFPSQRRFLFVSSLLEARPALSDPGLVVLLNRGLDRFFPEYAALEDLPPDVGSARRYLFTLDRLERGGTSRENEVAAGLFQASVEILSILSRTEALPPDEVRKLFAALLEIPLFATEGARPGASAAALFDWTEQRLLGSLRAAEGRRAEALRQEEARREAQYRADLAARDQRILARDTGRREESGKRRAAAEARLATFLGPVCPASDEDVGPPLPVFLDFERNLAESLPPAEPGARTREDEAEEIVDGAIALETDRARPLPPPTVRLRLPGAIPDSETLADATEPLPALDRLEVPAPSADSDELLSTALVGGPLPATLDWRGGRYRFDPGDDEAARRRAFRGLQHLTWLADLEALHEERNRLLTASRKADPAGARAAAAALARELRLAPSKDPAAAASDERLLKVESRARDAAAEIGAISDAGKLSRVAERMEALDALVAERHLEALLGHVYAASAGDPGDLYYQDPAFVRRHDLRTVEKDGRVMQSAFMRTRLVKREKGGGSVVTGSLFDLPDVLALLHADQLSYQAGAGAGSEDVRSGLVAPILRMDVAQIDDDALRFVAASCRATHQLVAALRDRSPQERFRLWNDLARDLVPRARLGLIASTDDATVAFDPASPMLSPSDAYRVGRRLVSASSDAAWPSVPAAAEARRFLDRLVAQHGEEGAARRLAQFGPRAVAYAGRSRLVDMDLPAYERLATYRMPQILSDRLYDLKIEVACRIDEAGLPAAVLPLVLPAVLDEILTSLQMSFAYDWAATVRAANAVDSFRVDRALEASLKSGRLRRVEAPAVASAAP